MATYTAYQFAEANGGIEKVERPLVEPEAGHVRVKVHYCGICHSDIFTKLGFLNTQFPRSPGHEVAGVVDAVGPAVTKWAKGDRVGLGWYGGSCAHCDSCREGDLILCDTMPVTGIQFDGGYSEYVYAREEGLAKVPDDVPLADAAPLMCAGITVYNSLRMLREFQGVTVGVQGIGGLGHLAIQFAHKMGYKVFALSRGKDKEALALQLGAQKYFDTTDPDFVAKVNAEGGVKVLVATSTSGAAMSTVLPTLAKNGTLLVLGAGMENIEVPPLLLISGRRKVMGNPSGTASDSEDTMKFAGTFGVNPMNEIYPIEKVTEAFERMLSNKANFRVVLDWGKGE